MHPRHWSEADFEVMSWHDCHVHGVRFSEGEHGSGALEFDIDYILEWRTEKEKFSFVLVPATLRFNEARNVRMSLDWESPSAAFGPFSLSGIERRSEQRPRYTATLWRAVVNWPAGYIEFEASGFTQTAWGREVVCSDQVLNPSERSAA